MTSYEYPGAAAAELIRRIQLIPDAHFEDPGDASADQIAEGRALWGRQIPLPSETAPKELLDASFFAGLLEEEGRSVAFSIGFQTKETAEAWELPASAFRAPVPLDAQSLRKLSLSTDPWRTHLAVEQRDGELLIWGLLQVGGARIGPSLPKPASFAP